VKPSKRMLGDKAYDSAELREELDQRGTKPVIPNRSNRKQPFGFSRRLYKLRWRIASAFNRLKDFRRIATRYDRLAKLPGLCLPRRCSCMVDLMSLDPTSYFPAQN
jgi:transposase